MNNPCYSSDDQLPAEYVSPASNTPLFARSSYAVRALLILVLLITLKVAAPLLVPIVLGIFLALLLAPFVKILQKWHLPKTLAIGVVMGAMLAVQFTGFVILSEPAAKWAQELPALIPSIKTKLNAVREPIAHMEDIAEQVQDLTTAPGKVSVPEVTISTPSALEVILTEAPYVVTFIAVSLFLTFFLLLCGDRIVRKSAALGTRFSHRRLIMRTAKSMHGEITRFLLTISAINVSLGGITTLMFWYLQVPNPVLWGVLVALANFAPYIGPAIMLLVVTAVGLVSFDTLAEALIAPMGLLLITMVEGQLVTPLVVGRRLNLSPLIVFLSVVVWGYVWGLVGALIAVPIIVTLKILLSSIPAARPFASLLTR